MFGRLPLSRTRKWLIGLTMATYTAVVIGVLTTSWLVHLDWQLVLFRPYKQWPQYHELLETVVVLGQRGPTAVIVLAWLGWRSWRHRDLRPLLVLGLALLLLNASVGAVKHGLGRLGPHYATTAGSSEMFSGGDIFPSGHTANAVVTWGVLAYLATRHRRVGAVIVAVFAFTVGMTTIYLGTHWVTDVLAGWTAGILILLVLPLFEPLVARADARIRTLWAQLHGAAVPRPVPVPSPLAARSRAVVMQRGPSAQESGYSRPAMVSAGPRTAAGASAASAGGSSRASEQRPHHSVVRTHSARHDRPSPSTPTGVRRPRQEQRAPRPTPLGGSRERNVG